MPGPKEYSPLKYDGLSAITLVAGVVLMGTGDYLFNRYQEAWLIDSFSVGFYTIAGFLGALSLGALTYLQYRKNRDYIGRHYLNSTRWIGWVFSTTCLLGLSCLLLRGFTNYYHLDLQNGFLFWPGVGLSLFSAVGWLVLGAINLYQNFRSRGISKLSEAPENKLVVESVSLGFGYKKQAQWNDIRTLSQGIKPSQNEGLTVEVINPEPAKKVARIRTLLAEVMSKTENQTLTYVPSQEASATLGTFVFKRQSPSAGQTYYSLDARMQTQAGVDQRLEHLNYLLRNDVLLSQLSHIYLPKPSSAAENAASERISDYLDRRGYEQSSAQSQQYRRKDYVPYQGSLALGRIENQKPQTSRMDGVFQWFINWVPSSVVKWLKNRTEQNRVAIDVLFNLSEYETINAEAHAQLLKELSVLKPLLKKLPTDKNDVLARLAKIYKARSLILHPDRNRVDDGSELFRQVTKAHDLLKSAIGKNHSWAMIASLKMEGENIEAEDEPEFNSFGVGVCSNNIMDVHLSFYDVLRKCQNDHLVFNEFQNLLISSAQEYQNKKHQEFKMSFVAAGPLFEQEKEILVAMKVTIEESFKAMEDMEKRLLRMLSETTPLTEDDDIVVTDAKKRLNEMKAFFNENILWYYDDWQKANERHAQQLGLWRIFVAQIDAESSPVSMSLALLASAPRVGIHEQISSSNNVVNSSGCNNV